MPRNFLVALQLMLFIPGLIFSSVSGVKSYHDLAAIIFFTIALISLAYPSKDGGISKDFRIDTLRKMSIFTGLFIFAMVLSSRANSLWGIAMLTVSAVFLLGLLYFSLWLRALRNKLSLPMEKQPPSELLAADELRGKRRKRKDLRALIGCKIILLL